MSTLQETIKDCACEVYSELRGGYAEVVYEEAMAVEFGLRGINYEIERTTEVFYKNRKVGIHKLDFVVDGKVVVELKAAASLSKSHVAQLRSYLKTIGIPSGVLVNFPYPDKDAPDFQGVDRPSEDTNGTKDTNARS